VDLRVKQRIIGIVVLIILLAVVIPLFFTGSKKTIKKTKLSATIPKPPPPPSIKPRQEPQAWVIQVASFGNRKNAVKLVNNLKNKKITAYLEQEGSKSNYKYHVFVGPLLNRDKADALVKNLQKTFHLKGLVKRYQI
jgi:cell division septation protein DedD